jgi:hypothetical protein
MTVFVGRWAMVLVDELLSERVWVDILELGHCF